MKFSELFTKTQKTAPRDEDSKNAKFLIKAGFVHKEMAGVYSYLPLGWRVMNKIIAIIREEMNNIGGQEVFLSSLQDSSSWKKSGRWEDEMHDIWFKTKLKNDTEVGLANTHEEAVTTIMKGHIGSWRDLSQPISVYQFQTKFRNEARAKSGIMRTREFIMKDLYTFAASQQDHEMVYEQVTDAYKKIFDRIGIGEKTYFTYASGGSFSKYSHEFQTLCDAGEDVIYVCEKCRIAVNKEIINEQSTCPKCNKKELKEEKAAEVGNIFNLGTRFSEALGLTFLNENKEEQLVVMGSYGIGPGRVMGTSVEVHSDEKGIMWPASIAPFAIHLIELPGGEVEAEKLYERLQTDEFRKKGIEVLYDNRYKMTPGEKFADADLIGIPYRVVVSEKTVAEDSVELKRRDQEQTQLIRTSELTASLFA